MGDPGSGSMAPPASEIQVREVTAFASVHDMILAAIMSYGATASLREIYQACEREGRIAYKRSGGSRLITQNDHWKSQIRHALYTCDRFVRAAEGADAWMLSRSYGPQEPQTTRVLIRLDELNQPGAAAASWAASLPTPSPRAPAAVPRKPRGRRAAGSPRGGGGAPPGPRSARVQSRARRTAFAEDTEEEAELSISADEEEATADAVSMGCTHYPSPNAAVRARCSNSTPTLNDVQMTDESSHNERALLWSRGQRRGDLRPQLCPRKVPAPDPTVDSADCTMVDSIAAPRARKACTEHSPIFSTSHRGPVPLSAGPRTRSLAPEAASLFRGPHEASPASRMQHEASPLSVARLGAALRSAADLPHILQSNTRAYSGEAESPPAQKAYPLRSRMGPRGTPGFGEYSTPEATAAAERAASVTAGPIKRRLKAAVKAAAEAEAEATASMAREASNLGASSKHSRSMEVDDSCTPPPATGHKLRSAGRPTIGSHLRTDSPMSAFKRVQPSRAPPYPSQLRQDVAGCSHSPLHGGTAGSFLHPGGFCMGTASSQLQPSKPSNVTASTRLPVLEDACGEGAESDNSGIGGTSRVLRSHMTPPAHMSADGPSRLAQAAHRLRPSSGGRG